MVTMNEFLQELEHEAGSTRRVLERVPQAQFDWKPHPKSMSMGQLALHVATIPGAIADVATRLTFDVRTSIPRPTPASSAELLGALSQSVATARKILGEMGDAGLTASWKMVDGQRELMTMPRMLLLRNVLFNHWYHHRGQLTVYLRQVGALLPATYGASADENPLAPK
jgi:uncharacterized damage-inducible protein DinB